MDDEEENYPDQKKKTKQKKTPKDLSQTPIDL